MSVKCINTTSDLALSASSSFALGYFMTGMFSEVSAVYGGAVAAIAALISKLVEPVFGKIFDREGSNAASIFIGKLISFIVASAVTLAVAIAIGWEFEFVAALVNLTIIGIFHASIGTCLLKADPILPEETA